jgi:hypothetical protein
VAGAGRADILAGLPDFFLLFGKACLRFGGKACLASSSSWQNCLNVGKSVSIEIFMKTDRYWRQH